MERIKACVPAMGHTYMGRSYILILALREVLGDTVFQFLKIKVKFAFPLGIEGLAITAS